MSDPAPTSTLNSAPAPAYISGNVIITPAQGDVIITEAEGDSTYLTVRKFIEGASYEGKDFVQLPTEAERNKLRVCRLHPSATLPTKAHPDDAGYDLYASYDGSVPPRSSLLVDTRIAIILPPETYGRIAPRSGLATRGIDVAAGVIDRGYRGCIQVLLRNHSDMPLTFRAGNKIAQLIIEVIKDVPVFEITRDQLEFDTSSRGAGGFGSSGK